MKACHRWLCWTLVACGLCAHAQIPLNQRQSGSELLSSSNLSIQNDPGLHPATLWLLEGEALWKTQPSNNVPSCESCHGDAQTSMRNVATKYPRKLGSELLNLEGQINQCRVQRQHQPAWPWESLPLLSVTSWVARQAKGQAIDAFSSPLLKQDLAAGRDLFFQRMGQINLSCAQCHDQRWGQKLAGVVIPQAHPTGYPLYRLEWQGVGSLQRRLRNCMNAVRAEPYAQGSIELTRLELYLMWRARGMPLETPALRP